MVDDSRLFAYTGTMDPKLLSPLVWAYVGDAVFELHVRLQLIPNVSKVQDLHRLAVGYVQAKSQAEALRAWEDCLTEEERGVVRRGRNAKSTVPRNTDVITYRHSTGFEALIGYLYLLGRNDRLAELLGAIKPR